MPETREKMHIYGKREKKMRIYIYIYIYKKVSNLFIYKQYNYLNLIILVIIINF